MLGSNYPGQAYPGQGYAGIIGIQFDARANSGYQAASGSYTWTHVVGTGANQILVVSVGLLSVVNSVTALTYNGVALTKLRSDVSVSTTVRTEIWYLVDPAQGSHTVSVTLNTASVSGASSTSYNNVNQGNPVDAQGGGTGVTGGGNGSANVFTATAAVGAWLVDAVATPATAITVGANQVQRANITGAVGSVGQSDRGAIVTPASTSMDWDNVGAATTWTMSTMALVPNAGATVYTQALTATLNFVGSQTKAITYPLTASLSFVGAIARTLKRAFTGSLSFSGAFSSLHQHFASFTASLPFSGAFSKKITKPLTANLSFVGTFTKASSRAFTGGLSFISALVKSPRRSFAATLNFSATFLKLTRRAFTANLALTGVLSRATRGFFTATVNFSGSIVKNPAKVLSGNLSFIGTATATVKRGLLGVARIISSSAENEPLSSSSSAVPLTTNLDNSPITSSSENPNLSSQPNTDIITSENALATLDGTQ